MKRVYRAALLRFNDQAQALYEADAALVVSPGPLGCPVVSDVGPWEVLRQRWEQAGESPVVEDWRGHLMAPGFVDLHIHYPQTDVMAAPAPGLLPWLENYTFPHESRFCQSDYARGVAEFFLDEMLRNGVTTALTFATSHPESVQALFEAAQARGLRWVTGKVLQDRHCPDGVRDQTEQSLVDTEALIQRWHGVQRLGYAITPRFAPTSSEAQLRGAGELAARYPNIWVQSHVAENRDEVRWVAQLFPQARSYLDVYQRFGLLRERAVYAHCIYLDEADRQAMRQSGAAAAVSPTSNLFLGSGFFDYAAAQAAGMRLGLASDVGGGTSFSPFHTMRAAYYVGREGSLKAGLSLTPAQLWWQHTAGAASAMGLAGVVGNLAPGCEADWVFINPRATPLLARKTDQAQSLEELLFALIVLADDRAIAQTRVAGRMV